MNDKKMDENFLQAVLDFAEKLKSSSGRNLFVNNFYEAAHDNGVRERVRERYAGSWLSA
jgi:GT2 family glycosyltransferase